MQSPPRYESTGDLAVKDINIMSIQDFLNQAKENSVVKAKQMAALELQNWNTNHESELKSKFGFTDKKLSARKKQLINSL